MQHARRPNRRLLRLISIVVPFLWLGAILVLSGLWPRLVPRQSAPPFDATAASDARAWQGGPAARLGVNLEASELAGDRLNDTLTALDRDGYHWVRFTLPWDAIEPQPGQFAWAQWDAAFAALAEHPVLQPLVVLNRSPQWARRAEDAGNPLAPPQERSTFGAFAAAVAQRYGSQIRYYQVWDEPNIAPHWGARPVDAGDYAGLLREGAAQVRAADPDAEIVLAALAPTTEKGGANQSDLSYLDALYQMGARTWFDIVAAQPYGFTDPPEAPASGERLNFARARLLRDVIASHGDAAPLWATSYGWNALPDDWAGSLSPWGDVTDAEQGRYASAAATAHDGLGPRFWAAACPDRPPDDPWRGFALCDVSGAARPVALALAEAARQPATLDPGDHAPDHPAIAYSDNWRVTPEGADPARTGDRLSFSFEGTGAALQVQGGPFWGVYRIWVDGQPANALPRDTGGAAYVVLYDPSGEARLVDVARGLPDGPHRLELVAEGGWGQWALQGVRIYGPEAIARGWIGWLLLVLAGLGTGLWVLLAAPELTRRSAAGLDALAAYPDPLYWGIGAGLLAVLVLSSLAALDLAALAGLGLLFLVRPDAALPWLAFSLPFWPRPEVLLGRQFSHFELLVWLGLLALVARSLLAWAAGRGGPRGISGLDWPALAFVGIGLLAALAAEHRGLALREFRTVFLDAALFYALLTRAPAPEGRMYSPWPAVNGLLLGAAIVSLLALWQGLTGQGRIEVEGVWRVRALYGSPNNLALYLDRVVPLAAALAAFGARRRWFYALIALLSAAACLATFSKGAWLLGLPVGLAVVLLGGAWRTRRRWPVAALAGLAAAGVAGVALLARTPRMAGLLNFRSGTSFLRLQLWQSAWRMGLEHPALGVGPDNFLYAYRTRYVLPAAWEELNLNHPHNVVLDLWTRLGLLGLAAGAWLAAATGRAGWRLFRDGPTELWPLALGLLAGLAAGLAHGLIDNSLFLVDLMALFLLAAGLFERAREALVVSS